MEQGTRKKGIVDARQKIRKVSVMGKEKKRRLILSDSDSDSDEIQASAEKKLGLGSLENGRLSIVGEDEELGGGTTMKEELVVGKMENVVQANKALRSDLEQVEDVSIEIGVIQLPSDRKKIDISETDLSPKGIETLSNAEVPDGIDASDIRKGSDINGANASDELLEMKKENAADLNKGMLRSCLVNNEEEGSDEKNVVQLQVERKRGGEPTEARISVGRTKGESDTIVPAGRDNYNMCKDKLVKNNEINIQIKKGILRSDIRREHISDIEDANRFSLERKRIREPPESSVSHGRTKSSLHYEVPLKRTEIGPSKSQEQIVEGNKVKNVPNNTLRQGDDKGSAIDDSQCLETVSNAESESDAVTENRKHMNSDKNRKKQEENIKWIERSGTRVFNLLKDRGTSSASSQKRASCTIRNDGSVLKVQGTSPNSKKVVGHDNFHSKRRQDEKPNVSGSRGVVLHHGASKDASTSLERRFHEKTRSGVTVGNFFTKEVTQSPNMKRILNEAKRKSEVPAAELSMKTKISVDNATGSRKKASGSKTPILSLSKEKTDDFSKSAAKQSLRDKIKGILIDAGWSIDLRPRKCKKYLDSVYIPPSGRGSYWSITKAYSVYQEQLNSGDAECNKRTVKNMKSSGTNSNAEGSSSSLPIIPLESLSMLKRVTVNKRRSKEEIEEVTWHKKRKAKEISYKMSPKRYGNMKFDDIKKKRRSDDSLDSDAYASVSSMAHKGFLMRKDHQKGRALLARGSNQEAECDNEDYVPYEWKRTVLSWMIDLGVVPINGKVKYMNSRRTKEMLEGWIKREGIHCSCCSKIIPISKFELHAGSKLQQASENIHVEGPGVSLLQCQLDAWEKQEISERQGFYEIDVTGEDPNDDTCGICGDGGDLICCDSCPSTFHLSCLGFKMLPPGDWNCTNCSCCFCGVTSTSDVHDVDRTTLLTCSQCERKYHQNCVPEPDPVHNSGISFCEQSCRKVFRQVQRLIGTKNVLEEGFSLRLIRRFDEDSSGSLHSVAKRAECNSKIAVALAVMDECFLPITDQRSGINLIHNVVYNCGSNFSRLNYKGFYTFVLERGEEIISAASVRFHGTRLAEMPFIGTRNMYRRQGMARRLLDGIETVLYSLNVQKLVIPAISELRDTWTNVFGFKPPESFEEQEFRSINMLVFPGTGLLQKNLLGKSSSAQKKLAVAAKCEESNQDQHEPSSLPNVANNLENPHKCLADELVGSQDSASPTCSDVPNQSEVSLIEQKSSEVYGNEDTDFTPASVGHVSPVAEVQSQAMKTACQLLCEVKENVNLELKNTKTESISDGKSVDQACSNSISHEHEHRVMTETLANIGMVPSSGHMKNEDLYDEPIPSIGNVYMESRVSSTIIEFSVASSGDMSQASITSGENHKLKGVPEIGPMIACDDKSEDKSSEQKTDLSKIPIGSEKLPSAIKSATQSTYVCANSCINTLHLSAHAKPCGSCNGDNVLEINKGKP